MPEKSSYFLNKTNLNDGCSTKTPKWPWNNFIINKISGIYNVDLEYNNTLFNVTYFNYEECPKMFLIEETSFYAEYLQIKPL